jgi:hypothetical protein
MARVGIIILYKFFFPPLYLIFLIRIPFYQSQRYPNLSAKHLYITQETLIFKPENHDTSHLYIIGYFPRIQKDQCIFPWNRKVGKYKCWSFSSREASNVFFSSAFLECNQKKAKMDMGKVKRQGYKVEPGKAQWIFPRNFMLVRLNLL